LPGGRVHRRPGCAPAAPAHAAAGLAREPARAAPPTCWACITWWARSSPAWLRACCTSACRCWPRTRTCTRCA
ncbi:hypothetical protein C7E12_22965, partial [Stenotrophomonas maltophilia]